jgi:hypothetical protein
LLTITYIIRSTLEKDNRMNQSISQVDRWKRFPWLYVVCWVLGIALVVHGAYRIHMLISSWSAFEVSANIFTGVSPYCYLLEYLLKIAAGISIFFRRKFSILLVLAWMAAISFLSLGVQVLVQLPVQSWLANLEPATVLLLLLILLGRRSLR